MCHPKAKVLDSQTHFLLVDSLQEEVEAQGSQITAIQLLGLTSLPIIEQALWPPTMQCYLEFRIMKRWH